MTETMVVRIDSIAAGGDGVGRHDGMVLFVPRAAPGDVARVRAERHQRLLRGRLESLVEPSTLRVDPPCAHYTADRCGGCQLQHLTYEAQLAAKAGIIRDALVRIGKVDVEAPEVRPSAAEFRYRLKLTLTLRPGQGKWIAGLRRFDAPDEVFELVDCPITRKDVLGVWASVMARQDLLPAARELRGAVRSTERGYSFTLEGAQAWPNHLAFFEGVEALSELWWKPEGKSRRQLHSRERQHGGASFAQVNAGVAAELRARVLSLAGKYEPTSVVDAYAGSGDLAVALAEGGARVLAIELDRDAARVAASRLPAGSSVVAAPVEQALAGALPADLVILNPPRAGVDARVTGILNAQRPGPRVIIYVSCNPATLARDVRRMERYRVASVHGFDMFPQTAHVETVCELVPAA